MRCHDITFSILQFSSHSPRSMHHPPSELTVVYTMSSYKSIDSFSRAQRPPAFAELEDDYKLQVSKEWNTTAASQHATIEFTERCTVSNLSISGSTPSRNNRTVHRRGLLTRLMETLMKKLSNRATKMATEKHMKRSPGVVTHPHQHATIEVLPDDALLIVFHFYQMSSPSHWHRLAHVCQTWRCTIFASLRSLNLRLFCTYG
ncbi:hypothetical protein EI94DRAFT_1829469, partial [Lactarius quietus]